MHHSHSWRRWKRHEDRRLLSRSSIKAPIVTLHLNSLPLRHPTEK